MNHFAKARALTLAAALLAASSASAGQISSIDFTRITTDPGPYTPFVTYSSIIFTDLAKTNTLGRIVWKESDVQAPGIKVVNGDDKDGTYCVMTSGYNPADLSPKMCSDDLKFSKRFKLHGDVEDTSVDVSFNVIPAVTRNYRLFMKYSDYTQLRWGGYTIQLGFVDANGVFTVSKALDGLGFASSKGLVYTKPVSTTSTKAVDFSAYFAEGLFGPVDKYHPEPGYFNPLLRGGFHMTAVEDQIVSTELMAPYGNLFGDWLPVGQVPYGMYWDADMDPNTDNILVGNCKGTFDELTNTCNGVWETYRSCIEPDADLDATLCDSDGVAKPLSAATLATWAANPWITPGPIEDLANLGLTFYVNVGDVTKWPSYNGTAAKFVVRFTNHTVP